MLAHSVLLTLNQEKHTLTLEKPAVIKEMKSRHILEHSRAVMYNSLSGHTGYQGGIRPCPLIIDFLCPLCMSACLCVDSALFIEHWEQESQYRSSLINLTVFTLNSRQLMSLLCLTPASPPYLLPQSLEP